MASTYRLIPGWSDAWPHTVVSATGVPDLPLTVFASELRHSLSQVSIRVYVREVLALANWASTDSVSLGNRWSLLGSPD